jgi:hypothetical protein
MRTAFGRHVYAVGGNADAAWLSGVRVERVQLAVYAIAGVSAALAGVLVARDCPPAIHERASITSSMRSLMISGPFSNSCSSQREHGLDADGAPCRYPARRERDHEEQSRDERERQRISRADAEQQT